MAMPIPIEVGGGRRSRYRALTLVELLTVLMILTIIGAIVFSAATGAKIRGKVAVDISNLRQLGAAAVMYAADHDDIVCLSLHQLYAHQKFESGICQSPFDTSVEGHTFLTRAEVIRANVGMTEQIPIRCSYIGIGDGNWPFDIFRDQVLSQKNPGWLVNVSRTADSKKFYFFPRGTFQRLNVDGSVVTRMGGKIDDRVRVFKYHFYDR